MLAQMVRERAPQNYRLHLYDLPEFDLTDRDQVLQEMENLQPDIIVNCAAYTNVDGAEKERELAMKVNGTAVGFIAEAAARIDATLVHISTDYVFDGTRVDPYKETDSTNPMSVYGKSKLLGEQSIMASGLTKHFIVRTSWLYGPGGSNFVETIIRLAATSEDLRIIDDQIGSPTYTADLADAIFQLLALNHHRSPVTGHDPYGTYHFSNEGHCSWYEFACAIVEEVRDNGLECKVSAIHPICTEEYPLPAKRPTNSMFDKSKYKAATGAEIPEWRESLRGYVLSRDA